MKLTKLVLLVPCHSIEDFPIHYRGAAAENLLDCWTALWHPALLRAFRAMPQIGRADEPASSFESCLIVAPQISTENIEADFAEKVVLGNNHFCRGTAPRNEIADRLIGDLELENSFERNWIDNFFALGYALLQIQLMTRQLRYESMLDETRLESCVVRAAEQIAGSAGTEGPAEFQKCIDLLHEERCHYYPADASFIDLTLVAQTTISEKLAQQFDGEQPQNLLISGETTALLAEHPQTLELIRRNAETGKASIAGGEWSELPLPLLSISSFLSQLRRGRDTYRAHLGQSPRIYARRRFGLTALSPTMIRDFGFSAAIHSTLDSGQFPTSSQAVVRWTGLGESEIEALGSIPIDASSPDSFLDLGITIGESIDRDHYAVAVFAHWPGSTHTYYEDLLRIGKFGPLFGRFCRLEDFFDQVDVPGFTESFTQSEYHSPYLLQSVRDGQSDPISRIQRYWKSNAKIQSTSAVREMTRAVSSLAADEPGPNPDATSIAALQATLDDELDRPIRSVDAEPLASSIRASWDDSISELSQEISAAESGDRGTLIVNPLSVDRKMLASIDGEFELAGQAGVDVSAARDQRTHVVADVPGMGFVFLPNDNVPGKKKRREQNIGADHTLQNEFFELTVDDETGGIRSIHSFHQRGNLLSQRLAMRIASEGKPRGRGEARYTKMRASSVELVESNPVFARIISRGQLTEGGGSSDQATPVADFQQTVEVIRGRPLARIQLTLDPIRMPKGNPWNEYYAVRIAWNDDRARIWRAVQESRSEVNLARFEAPLYVGIDLPAEKLTLFPCGLPWHQLIGMRKLDSLLVVSGETETTFDFAIGVGISHPLQTAAELLTPDCVMPGVVRPRVDRGWLYRISAKNIVVIAWEPAEPGDSSHVHGCKVTMKETEGRPVHFNFSAPRPIQNAAKLNVAGEQVNSCTIDDGNAVVDMQAHECCCLHVFW